MIYTLLSTFVDTNDFDYDDYLEFCEMNNIEPAEKDSPEFYEWCVDETNLNIECDWENLTEYDKDFSHFVITGKLGLWNGKHEILPIIEDSLCNAIKKCISGGSILDYKVTLDTETGVVSVSAHHHDGVNFFNIYLLTDEGFDAITNAIDDYKYGDLDHIELNPDWCKKIA